MNALLRAENVSMAFGSQKVLENVSITLRPKEIVTVIGPNGAGKSSLVRLFVGEIQPHQGQILRAEGLRLGYVPQKLELNGQMPIIVRRFMELNLASSPKTRDHALKQCGADGLIDREISNLSGGELKRVLLAFALSCNPNLLILDEPTAGLDQPAMIAFYALLEEMRDQLGLAVLLVSHDLNVVMRASNHVICLNRHICCQGAPDDVSADPEFHVFFGARETPFSFYQHHHSHSHDEGICQHD